jgi:hypothetical protein
MPDTELRDAVIHHDLQLTALSTRITDVEDKIDSIGGKIDHLVEAMSQRPAIDFSAMLSHVRDGAVILGLAVSAIIYVASGYSSAEIAVMKEKDKRFENIYERNVTRMDQFEKRLLEMETNHRIQNAK